MFWAEEGKVCTFERTENVHQCCTKMARTKKLVALILVGVPALCCLGGIGYVQYQLNSVGSGLEAELAKAKSLGMPVLPDELNRHIPTPQNGAPLYLQAIALAEAPQASAGLKVMRDALGSNPTTAEGQAAAIAFKEAQPILKLVEEAADKPHSDFRKDWKLGFNVMFPEYAHLKQFTNVLRYKSQQQSKSGEWRGALQSIKRMQRISRHAGEEPILIAMLVQLACESITHTAFREVISDHRKNPAFLSEAKRVAERFGPLPNFRHALKGELVIARSAIYEIRNFSDISGHGSTETDAFGKLLGGSRSLRVAFDRKLVESHNDLVQSIPSDPSDWKGSSQASKDHDRRIDADKSLLNTMNRIFFPVFSQAAAAVGKAETNRRLTQATIALMHLHNRTGSYPSKLPSSALFIDPFSDKPFVYKPAKDGFLLYSLDQDGVDNGGSIKSVNSQRDIVVDTRAKQASKSRAGKASETYAGSGLER